MALLTAEQAATHRFFPQLFVAAPAFDALLNPLRRHPFNVHKLQIGLPAKPPIYLQLPLPS